MLKCLSKNLMLPVLMPLAMSLPTWCGDRRSIMLRRAHLFSVSAPEDAPTKRLNLSLPWRLFFSTWSASASGTFLYGKWVLCKIQVEVGERLLRISNAREARPSNVGTRGEQVNQILSLGNLLKVCRSPHTASERCRYRHGGLRKRNWWAWAAYSEVAKSSEAPRVKVLIDVWLTEWWKTTCLDQIMSCHDFVSEPTYLILPR